VVVELVFARLHKLSHPVPNNEDPWLLFLHDVAI
jgi:hypothetical protein